MQLLFSEMFSNLIAYLIMFQQKLQFNICICCKFNYLVATIYNWNESIMTKRLGLHQKFKLTFQFVNKIDIVLSVIGFDGIYPKMVWY